MLKNKQEIGFLIWAAGLIALATYVPYGVYYVSLPEALLIQDVTGYDWFFKHYGKQNASEFVMINYSLMWSKIGAWTALFIGYLYVAKDQK